MGLRGSFRGLRRTRSRTLSDWPRPPLGAGGGDVMRRLEVRLSWGPNEVPVGTLAEEGRRIFFEYDESFLRGPLPISPFLLPSRAGLFQEVEGVYGGLFGVFNDSLPDGWGLLLMDRAFRKRGMDPYRITPLDRLAYVGTRGMGALTYHPS